MCLITLSLVTMMEDSYSLKENFLEKLLRENLRDTGIVF